jgi:membrane protein
MPKRSFWRLCKIAIGEEKESSLAGRLEHFIHFCFFVGKGFIQNRCLVRASALSYTTLLAMIPLLAVAISVTSGLLKKEGEQDIYRAIDKFISQVMPPATLPAANNETGQIPPNENSTNTNAVVSPADAANARVTAQLVVAEHIHEFIHNTRSGALGVTGMALLVFVALSMLDSIEGTFNDIWGVERGRNWFKRLARYWMALTLGPLLIAVAVGLAGGSHLQATRSLMEHTPGVHLLFKFGTLLCIWLAFALLYEFTPNTKVHFSAALVGGMVSGTLWHLNNLFGFLYVSRVITNSRMYGSLGLIPVLMAGLYLSWVILLFGAQIAYAFQNRKIYLQEKAMETVPQRDREILALRLMSSIGRRFYRREKPAAIQEISDELEIPSKLVQQVLQRLLDAQIVTEVSGAAAFVPARPLETITAHDILMALRAGHGESPPAFGSPCTREVLDEFEKIEHAERAAAEPVTLLTLIQRCP